MKLLETQILIIGGGPAGSTTALYLSQLGFKIILIEKKIFPRETLCGEFLSKEVTDVLKDLNLFEEFIKLNPNKITRFKAISNTGIELKSNLNFTAYALKRSIFDSFLLDKAKENNINVIQPAEVISISKTKQEFISEIKSSSIESFQIKSNIVIAAYGKQNILDKKLNRDFISYKSYLNGVKFHLPVKLLKENITDEIRIYSNKEFYCGINRVSKDEVTVCFLDKRKDSNISAREKLINVIRANKLFHKVFSDEALEYIKSTIIYGSGNIYFGKRALIKNDIIMVGDCAQIISPLAGDGIGMAMESAKILSNILKGIKTYNLDIKMISISYNNIFREVFRRRLISASIIQKILFNNMLSKIGYKIMNKFPSILSQLINITRSSNKLYTKNI